MARICLTLSFQKQLKSYHRHFTTELIVEDLRKFSIHGLGFGETVLFSRTYSEQPLEVVKIRFREGSTHARYLTAITTTEGDLLPFFFSLKSERHGQNLGHRGGRETREIMLTALARVAEEYTSHSPENPTMLCFKF